MYNTIGLTSKGLSLTKIIGGISKTLQIANQVIPLYQKAKPMIHNARSLFSVVKEMKKTTNTPNTINNSQKLNTPNNSASKSQQNTIKKESTLSPTFFL